MSKLSLKYFYYFNWKSPNFGFINKFQLFLMNILHTQQNHSKPRGRHLQSGRSKWAWNGHARVQSVDGNGRGFGVAGIYAKTGFDGEKPNTADIQARKEAEIGWGGVEKVGLPTEDFVQIWGCISHWGGTAFPTGSAGRGQARGWILNFYKWMGIFCTFKISEKNRGRSLYQISSFLKFC